MLNKVYPRSKYIFEASGILDEIRAELLTLETAKGSAQIIGRIEHICLNTDSKVTVAQSAVLSKFVGHRANAGMAQ
jgi:hypothetical protein